MKYSILLVCLFLYFCLASNVEVRAQQHPPLQHNISLRGDRIAITTNVFGHADRFYIAREHSIQCLGPHLKTAIWSVPISSGAIDEGPIVVDEAVIYVSNDMSTVTAVNANNGSLEWSRSVQTAHITGSGKTVFLTTSTGMGVEALDAQTGKTKWVYEPGGPGSIFQLQYAAGNIYTESYVLNADSGKLLATNIRSVAVLGANASSVFKAFNDGTLEDIDARSNTVRWKTLSSPHMRPVAISYSSRLLFLVEYDGMPFVAQTGKVRAFNLADGHAVWELPITAENRGLQPNPISVDSNSLYLLYPVGDDKTRLIDVRISDRKQVWSRDLIGQLEGPPVIVGESLYITDGPNVLYEIDKATGKVLHQVELPKE